ncbi:MAG: GDP-mannose 4,6-dehydratase [Gammaproteobacteria bacterium]
MHILVTGGAGFIGSHIVEYHLNKGDTVYAVDDLSTGSIQNLKPFENHPNFRFDSADISNWSELDKAVAWADRIYHMAAVVGVYKVLDDPLRVLSVNITACERLLNEIKISGWKPRVIIASSSEVYGSSKKEFLSEDDDLIIDAHAKNRWNYPISKLADEAIGLSSYNVNNIPVTLVRFFNTVGPRQTGQYGMVVPRFVKQALAEEDITVFGDGNQTRSFCDVRDTVNMLDMLANTEKSIGEIVNVGNDREITINELAALVKTLIKSKSKVKNIPYKEAYGQEYFDIPRRRPNLKKLNSLISYQHQWTLEDTINDLIK